jgi:D-alanyl-D-alanine carboxypeptidase
MIIQKVTGQPYGVAVEQRIIEPLGLTATSVPGTSSSMPLPSSHSYSKLSPTPTAADPTYDVTDLNPSEAGSAGEIISDSNDLDRFYSALLGGKLLPAAQLKEMLTTVPVGSGLPFSGYGLGLMKFDLSCGVTVWGHIGGIQGSVSEAVATADGSHTIAFNFNGDWAGDYQSIVNAEYCPQ